VAVTDEGLEAVGQHCRQLRVLRLYANSGITDVGVKAVANLPHLEVHLPRHLAGVVVLRQCTQTATFHRSCCMRSAETSRGSCAAHVMKIHVLRLQGAFCSQLQHTVLKPTHTVHAKGTNVVLNSPADLASSISKAVNCASHRSSITTHSIRCWT
jgi:hypothetical protein